MGNLTNHLQIYVRHNLVVQCFSKVVLSRSPPFSELSGKTFNQIILVFPNPLEQVRSNTCVQGSIAFAGQ